MDKATHVQIVGEAIWISYSPELIQKEAILVSLLSNTLGKGAYPTIFPQVMSKLLDGVGSFTLARQSVFEKKPLHSNLLNYV